MCGMLFLDGGFGLVVLGLWVFCVIDVLTTDASRCRNLPKGAWALIVLVFFDIGSIAWLVAGHPWGPSDSAGLPYRGNRGGARSGTAESFPEYDRPGRFEAADPDDDHEFLAQVKARAEYQRRSYQQRRDAELRAEADRLHGKPVESDPIEPPDGTATD